MIHRSLSFLTLAALLASPINEAWSSSRSNSNSTVRKFISGWSQNIETSMIFLKLDTPALLETAKKDRDGNLIIDQAQLEAMLSEQEQLIGELLALSPKIQVLYRYRFVMNGLTVVAPSSLYQTILEMRPVKALSEPVHFQRPDPMRVENLAAIVDKARERLTTTDFIGASRVHNEFNIRGQGMHVGIIDSGIDYTHAMFGGPGTVEAFQSVNPLKETSLFPTEKVVGGYDFVGDVYNPGSLLTDIRIPRPDANPIDTSGHGTHVAGTVAGVGYDKQSFDGVAPDASLHALKVFGPRGGTSDLVVMAAMEYAVDPNGDFDPSDRLQVLNLSLGGIFGKPNNNYQEAVKNLSRAGIVVLASAGNSGAIPYVVGSPSTADEAMSIGASIDGMYHNWRYDAVTFAFEDNTDELIEAVEGPITLPVADAEGVKGKLVFAGLATEPFSPELAEKVRGNVALMLRGEVSFADKITHALNAGAIGVVMANNQPGNPIPMGGDGQFPIPGVMVTQAFGAQLINRTQQGQEVVIDFHPGRYIQQPEIVDTLASFSSQGPRSEDSRLKPEIVAPGYQIFSAAAGSGDRVVPMNGTSMSSPQMAGVMALMRQAYPRLSVEELQAITMNTARNMVDAQGKTYELSRQGAGRVQVYEAIAAGVIAKPKAFSLGEHRLSQGPVVVERTLNIRPLITDRSDTPKAVKLEVENARNMRIDMPESTIVRTRSSVKVRFTLTEEHASNGETILNHEAVIRVVDASTGELLARVPALAVGLRASKVMAHTVGDSLELTNPSRFHGVAWPFNSFLKGERHPDLGRDSDSVSVSCNLMKTGYRITAPSLTAGPQRLEFGFEIDQPVSRWEACTLIVLFSVKGGEGKYDEADLELVGSSAYRISDLGEVEIRNMYNSLLFDAPQSRTIRGAFEQVVLERGNDTGVPRPDYSQALLDLQPMLTREHGRTAMVSVLYAPLMRALRQKGLEGNEVYVKIGILNNTNSAYQYDSFIGGTQWHKLDLGASAQAFTGLPREVMVPTDSTIEIQLNRTNNAHGELLILTPDNL
jgi:minor extracellular serine protease Vpr